MKKLVFLLTLFFANFSFATQIHIRHIDEPAEDFINRIMPEGREKIHPVIETNWNNKEKKVIIAFWAEPMNDNGYSYQLAVSKMYVPIGEQKYKEVNISEVSPDPLEAVVESVFFYDIDGDGTRELAVLYSWEYKHYMMGGSSYGVYLYDTIDYDHPPNALTELEYINGGITGNNDIGENLIADFSTAADAKYYLDKLGKVDKSKLIIKQSFKGKIGNFPVTYMLDISGSVVSGFYFYDKKGIDIPVLGQHNRKGEVYIMERNGDYWAGVEGILTHTGFTGKWEDKNGKTYPVTLSRLNYVIHPLPENITGHYTFGVNDNTNKVTTCFIKLDITKEQHNYKYHLNINDKKYKGGVTFKRDGNNENQALYIVLEGYKWDSNLGDISKEDVPHVNTETYGLSWHWDNGTLSLQNSGNAMNHYVKIGDCDYKYINLTKSE